MSNEHEQPIMSNVASRVVIQKDQDFTMIIIGFREAQGRLVVIENKKILIVPVIKHTDQHKS